MHVCIKLSQTSAVPMLEPHALNFVPVHCTHVPALHTPLPAMFEHSASLVHAVHAPELHAEAVAVLQSLCCRQATHWPAVASQKGFAASLQSVGAVHSTQVFEATSHAGFGALHVDLSMHSTHLFVAVSQAAVGLAHVELSVHPTQVFVALRQTGVVPLHLPSHGEAPPAPASEFAPADAPA